jgi:hypothetical protein
MAVYALRLFLENRWCGLRARNGTPHMLGKVAREVNSESSPPR